MTWQQALASLERDDREQVLAYTATDVRLNPAPAWVHFVSLALWKSRHRLERMTAADNPDAYVRRVAKRLRHDDEQLVLGKHPVYDETGTRRIGHVTVGSFFREDGSTIEPSHVCERGGALGFVPADGVDAQAEVRGTARQRRAAAHNAKPLVLALDEDERDVQSAQRKGISRREMPGFLGWDERRVNRAYMRLYRRRGAV